MRVLREVAVRGSFSAAADALSFTQSAVSQQIAALERETGATLVERSARGVRLTDAGRALVKHTDAILARLTEAESELEAIAGLRGGRVRLAAFESAAATLMPPAIAEYRSRHPAVELSMTLSEPEGALPQLRAGELELAVIFGGALAESYSIEGLELVELLEDPLYLVLPGDHPLARKRNIRLSDLAARGVDRRAGRLRVHGADPALVRGRGLRPADHLRDRRLRRRPGPRGRRHGRLLDRRDGSLARARRHRGALARARDTGAPRLRGGPRRRLPLARDGGDARRAARDRRTPLRSPPGARARRLGGMRLRRRLSLAVAALAVGGIVAVASLVLWHFDVFERAELATVDARFAVREDPAKAKDVVIVGVDAQTLKDLNARPPIRRLYHARVIDRLREYGARVIAYDFQFTEFSDRPADDERLAQAVLDTSPKVPVVLATVDVLPGGKTQIFRGAVEKLGGHPANATVIADQDGIFRHLWYSERDLKTFAVVAAEHALKRRLTGPAYPAKGEWIDFAGGPGTVEELAFSDVMRGRVPASKIKGKVVVVGATAATFQDLHPVATSGTAPDERAGAAGQRDPVADARLAAEGARGHRLGAVDRAVVARRRGRLAARAARQRALAAPRAARRGDHVRAARRARSPASPSRSTPAGSCPPPMPCSASWCRRSGPARWRSRELEARSCATASAASSPSRRSTR